MIRTKFSKLLMGALLTSSIAVYAQNYQTMPIQSGFNADVIANGVGTSMTSTSTDVDGVSFAFVSKDFQLTSSSAALTYGLPVNGLINSVVTSTPGLNYQLASYSANNSLKLSAVNDSGTIVFATPVAATKLYMLSTSGSGVSTVNLVVNFTDGTSQTFSGVSLADWYNGSGFAIQGFGRINRTNDTLENGGGTNPRLYQTLHTIDPANQTKLIQNIVVTKATGVGLPNIFAFSVDAYTDCPAPVLQAPTNVTSNSAGVSWTAPAGAQFTSYDIYYSTTSTAPASGATPNITGITGTSHTIPGLNPSTQYYYWVRGHCSTATSIGSWSFSGNFTTLCGAMVPPYLNDFASFPGNCWDKNLSGGSPATGSTGTSGIWVSGGFLNAGSSGAMKVNLYSANRIGWVKTVPIDLSTGGYRVKFDYGVTAYNATGTSAMGSDDIVQFVVSTNGGSTWTVLQTWNAASGVTNTTNTFSYDLTSYTGASTLFAFYASEGTVNDTPDYDFHIDNFKVESVAQMATNEVSGVKKDLLIHPNPFSDVLNIADVSKVKSISVMDLSGKVVKSFEKPEASLRMSDLSSGMYLVVLNMLDGTKQTIKAIKK